MVSCVITAFKTNEEYANTNVMVLPESWLNFDNFIEAWKQANLGSAFLNSLLILVCVLVGSVLISAMLAFVLDRFKFTGNKLIRTLFTIATLIPGIASQVTVYQIMDSLHLVNTMHGYKIGRAPALNRREPPLNPTVHFLQYIVYVHRTCCHLPDIP